MTPYQAYYTCHLENKRIIELEPIILTNPDYSFYYAKDVIKDRWLKAEHIIKQDDWCWKKYCQHFNIKKEKCNWKVGL